MTNQEKQTTKAMNSKNFFNLRFLICTAAMAGFLVAGVITVEKDPAKAQAVALASLALPLLGAVVTDPKKELQASAEYDPNMFAQFVQELRAKINTVIAGLPPLEQFEAASELSYGLRALQRAAADMLEIAGLLDQRTQTFMTAISAKAEKDAEAKLLANGSYVSKTDAEAAQNAALEKREKEIRDTIAGEATAKAKTAAARAKLVADKVVTETVAASIPDDFFKPEGYEDRFAKLTARLGTIKEKKLTTEPFLAEMVALPLDEAGDRTFEARIKSVEGLVAASASRSGGAAETSLAAPGVEDAAVGIFF